jgi:hypothetical protein
MIYFIGCEEAGAVKIGLVSKRPYERLNQAQVNCPLVLELLAICEGGKPAEAELHARFSPFRIRGEWFRLTPELADLIAQHECPEKPARGWWGQSRNRLAKAA